MGNEKVMWRSVVGSWCKISNASWLPSLLVAISQWPLVANLNHMQIKWLPGTWKCQKLSDTTHVWKILAPSIVELGFLSNNSSRLLRVHCNPSIVLGTLYRFLYRFHVNSVISKLLFPFYEKGNYILTPAWFVFCFVWSKSHF